MAVLDPLKLIIINYPEGQTEELLSENGPDESFGTRLVPFNKELWIEEEDFMEIPAKKYFRLAPGAKVRLKSAYIVQCDSFIKDATGKVTEIHCTYFPESKSGNDTSGIVVKGTIHWVSAIHALKASIRLYDRLLQIENPSLEEGDFKSYINPQSLQVIDTAYVEPSLKDAPIHRGYQFIRKGYFCLDKNSTPTELIFNRTVSLKDTWAKETKRN